jgi:tripartite ATP-independent transporter DctP family solute receptor
MKKLKIIGILFFFALFILGAGYAAAKTITIKVGHGHSIQHPVNQGFLLFQELIQKKTDGRMKVEVFPSAQLGNESEMAELCKLGTMQGIMFGRYEEMSPMLYAFTLPFLFKDFGHVERVLAGPAGDYIASFTEDHGLKLVGWAHSGFRQITNNVRPIRTPDDLKGLKMRTPPLENILRAMRAFGASPTPIAYPEVYMACKTGVVDGQENPFVNIYSEKFYEVQKYMSIVNYIYLPGPFCVGLKFWNSLSPEDKVIVDTCAKVATDYTNVLTVSSNENYLRLLKKEGMQVYQPTEGERAQFIEKVGPVYDYFIGKGVTTKRFIDLIQLTK